MRRTSVVVFAAFSLRIEEAIAERGEVLSKQRVQLCRFLFSKRKQKTRRQVGHGSLDRDGVLRHETGRPDEDSEQIQVLACPQGPRTAAAWRHEGCGRLPSAPTDLR